MLKAIDLKNSCKLLIKHYEENVAKLDDGTYKFDGSMPESCIEALERKKLRTYKEALEHLSKIPDEKIVVGERGYGAEYAKYLEIVNK